MKMLFCASVFALAALTAVAPAQELDTRHYIYIEASGSVSLPAEYATIGATANSKAPTPDAAVDLNNETMERVMAALQQAGVRRSDIETRQFGFETVYIKPATASTYEQPDPNRDKFDGYRVTNSFTVRVTALDSIGDVLGIISRSGVEIGALGFGTSKSAGAEETTREMAVENAFTRAALMAKASNVRLGALLQMREGRNYNPETMEDYPVDGYADLVPSPVTGIVPADIVVTNSVSAKWEVLPLE